MPNHIEAPAYCIEYFHAKPGCRDQLAMELSKLIAPTKKEPGCLQYDILQDNKDTNLIILLVKFSSQATMLVHENNSFIKEFSENVMKKYCEKLTWNDATEIVTP